jgi:glyoxylase-like metal-dependent hydrolase (beta-lactamase superfamily II)
MYPKMKQWSTRSGYKIIRVLAGRSNVFLLTNGQSNILVDTSPGFMWNLLQNRLAILKIEKIDLLILTHSHFDHAANAARLRDKYQALVLIHRSESKYLNSGDNILPSGTNRFSRFLVRTMAERFRSVARYQPCNADLIFYEVYDLADYGFNAYLMHTPGHTEGSCSLIVDNEFAITGDTMFGVFPGSIFPPFANDVSQLLKSWEMLLATGCKLFLPSHGSENKRSLVEKDYNKRK